MNHDCYPVPEATTSVPGHTQFGNWSKDKVTRSQSLGLYNTEIQKSGLNWHSKLPSDSYWNRLDSWVAPNSFLSIILKSRHPASSTWYCAMYEQRKIGRIHHPAALRATKKVIPHRSPHWIFFSVYAVIRANQICLGGKLPRKQKTTKAIQRSNRV
jgi:hypothetical protein